MITNSLWRALIGALLLGSALISQARASERIEMPVGHVFVPARGYDDNDNIQIVLDGILPDGCYSVSDEPTSVDPVSKQISIRLFANHRTDGPCADEDHLPHSLLPVVPFTLDVSVGTLPRGRYQVVYPRPGLPDGVRSFRVEKAKALTIDDVPYANVDSVSIPDTVPGDQDIHARLLGALTSSCSQLDSDISVDVQGDVIVVRPRLNFARNLICSLISVPYERTFSIGKLAEGRYLLQVRSRNGKSVNRTFSVIEQDPL